MTQHPIISSLIDSLGQLSIPWALVDPTSLRCTYMNMAFQRMDQRERTSPSYQLFDERPDVVQAFQACLQGQAEVLVSRDDWQQPLRLVPLHADGKLLAIQCFVSLVDSGYKKHSVLEQRYLQVIEQLPMQVWLAKTNGDVFWANQALHEFVYGPGQPGDIRDAAWVQCVPPEDLAQTQAWWLRFAKEPTREGVVYRMRARDGQYQWFYTTAMNVLSANGAVLYVVGINLNIDHFKTIEHDQAQEIDAVRAQYAQHLEKALAVQQELVSSQKRELIESLAGGVSHDLNNMLFVMNLNSNLLKKRLTDERDLGYVDSIQKAIKKAGRLATQLMSFSGRKSQASQAADPRAVVEEIEDLLRNAASAEVTFKLEIAPTLGTIKVDKTYLENALINLTLNARDAVSEHGEVVIRVYNSQHADHPQLQYVVFEVADNGMGMSDEVRERIFHPFYTTKEQGNGLGLPMVKNFILQSDGLIRVQSTLGEGTSIFLYLPHSDEQVFYAPGTIAQAARGEESILVVEDTAEVRTSMAQALSELGYRVSTAHNPDIALKYIRGGLKVDLIVSDIRMPGSLQSIDMLRILQADGHTIPVLFATGYSGDVLIENSLINGQYQVLFKPFSMDELGSKIREVLQLRPSGQSAV